HADGPTFHFHRGAYLGWTGTHYHERTEDDIRAMLYEFLGPVAFHITRAVVSNLLHALRAQSNVLSSIEPPSWLGVSRDSRNYISLQNGILDLKALLANEHNVLLSHSPSWFSQVCLPFEFNAEATCPRFLAFLDRNLEGDEQRIQLLQEWTGYCLVSDTSLQK